MTDGGALLQIGFGQALAFFAALFILLISGLGGMLKYFFQKDSTATEARFTQILRGQAEMKEEMAAAIEKIDTEVRALDRRVQQVELDQARRYVPRTEYEPAIQRVHDRLDTILAAVKEVKG